MDTKPSVHQQTSTSMFFYLLIAVIAFGIVCVWRIPEFTDVLGWDEGLYMQNGLLFTTKLQKAWGPIYAAWYYFLHFFQSHPLSLYLLNFQVLTVVPGVLFYIYWTRLSIRPLYAAVIAMFYIASHINFYSWPKISLFTATLIALVFVVSTFFKKRIDQIIIIAGGVIFASYMRPELYLAFLLLFVIIITLLFKDILKKIKVDKITWGLFALLVVGTMGLQKWLGNPLFNFEGEGGRAVAAFGQHFAYNYTIWNDLRPDRWQLHADIIIREVFGDVENIGEAIKANPDPIYHHFLYNCYHYLKNLWKFYTDIFLPESIFYLSTIPRSIILIGLFLSVLAFRMFNFKQWWSTFKEHTWDWILLFIVVSPTFISVIVIFPREHYMVLQVILILTLILTLSYGFTGWKGLATSRTHLGIISAIVFLLILLAPSAENRPYFDNFRQPKGNFNVQSSKVLENFIPLQDTIAISENEGGIISFIPTELAQHYKWTPAVWKKTNFKHFADSLNTQMYYVTPLFLYDDRYLYDEEWQDFLTSYSESGYKKIEIANEWYFLYDTTAVRYQPRSIYD
ncbi:MAG TPA: hypothetical protein VFD65_06260 [Chitinophagales bacterium]|nr:hypothetical protein [Chitinophagales bacterium]